MFEWLFRYVIVWLVAFLVFALVLRFPGRWKVAPFLIGCVYLVMAVGLLLHLFSF